MPATRHDFLVLQGDVLFLFLRYLTWRKSPVNDVCVLNCVKFFI